jgi:GNAT superfamily N-acetyltransferase
MFPHSSAQQLERVGCEYMLRWLSLMPDVTVTAFGAARGACCAAVPDLDFLNTVHGLLPADGDLVPVIAERYRAAGVQPWLELMPAPDFEKLADALDAAGGRQVGFLAMHERDLPAPPPGTLPHGVAVELLGEDVDDFARVLPAGHGVPEAGLAGAIDRTRRCAQIEGARLYLATVAGAPAAAAVLFLAGDVAYLANASTLEAHRRRGCQTALIQRRLADAAAAGCRRAGAITGWDTQSHANMARAGFRTAYTKAVWRLDRPV